MTASKNTTLWGAGNKSYWEILRVRPQKKTGCGNFAIANTPNKNSKLYENVQEDNKKQFFNVTPSKNKGKLQIYATFFSWFQIYVWHNKSMFTQQIYVYVMC